jgi:RNA polymerase sigma factor (TIGR02999 family)
MAAKVQNESTDPGGVADTFAGRGPPVQAVYDELRKIARQFLRHERPGHTLQATALVHEVYLRFAGGTPLHGAGRTQFFAAAAEAMRRLLLQHARNRGRLKRGGGRERIELDLVELADAADANDIRAVDEAIQRLEEQDSRLGQLVKLRFFAGLSVEETAKVLEMSPRTVRRDWQLAKAWLTRELRE